GFILGCRLYWDVIDQASQQALLDGWIDVELCFGFVAEQLALEPVDLALGDLELRTQGRIFCDHRVIFLFQRSRSQLIDCSFKACAYYTIARSGKELGRHLFRRFFTTNSKPSTKASNSAGLNASTTP